MAGLYAMLPQIITEVRPHIVFSKKKLWVPQMFQIHSLIHTKNQENSVTPKIWHVKAKKRVKKNGGTTSNDSLTHYRGSPIVFSGK